MALQENDDWIQKLFTEATKEFPHGADTSPASDNQPEQEKWAALRERRSKDDTKGEGTWEQFVAAFESGETEVAPSTENPIEQLRETLTPLLLPGEKQHPKTETHYEEDPFLGKGPIYMLPRTDAIDPSGGALRRLLQKGPRERHLIEVAYAPSTGNMRVEITHIEILPDDTKRTNLSAVIKIHPDNRIFGEGVNAAGQQFLIGASDPRAVNGTNHAVDLALQAAKKLTQPKN